jgi:hypothetical protein
LASVAAVNGFAAGCTQRKATSASISSLSKRKSGIEVCARKLRGFFSQARSHSAVVRSASPSRCGAALRQLS